MHGFTATIFHKPLKNQEHAKPQALKAPIEQSNQAPDKDSDAHSEPNNGPEISFTDAFLLAPHTSSIRAVAVSPALHGKRYIASGGADERVIVYQVGATSPLSSIDSANVKRQKLDVELDIERKAALAGKELGTLTPHTATITGLSFCGHAKLLSTSMDNSICITRTRDWTPLTTLKAPHPQASHRPDGDTYASGEGPEGIVSCGVHPSFKLGVSVGIGERALRLWDLVKGKRAGVLAFDKKTLQELGEWGSLRDGEGRQVHWDPQGDKFAVAFEKGIAIFSVACDVKGVAKIGPREKVGCVRWVTEDVLAVATERGRVLLYAVSDLVDSSVTDNLEENVKPRLPELRCKAQLVESPTKSGTLSRIKDIQILRVTDEEQDGYYFITGSSDGAVRILSVPAEDLSGEEDNDRSGERPPRQVGSLVASNETGHRITCLTAFLMDERQADALDYEEDTPHVNGHTERGTNQVLHAGSASAEKPLSDGSALDHDSPESSHEDQEQDEGEFEGFSDD